MDYTLLFLLAALVFIGGWQCCLWWHRRPPSPPTPYERALCGSAMKARRSAVSALHGAEFTNGFIAGQMSKH